MGTRGRHGHYRQPWYGVLGGHAERVEQNGADAPSYASALAGPLPRRDSPALQLVESLHSERADALRAIQVEITMSATYLTAVLVEEDGYPVLSVARVDASRRSTRVGCLYQDGAWHFATPDHGVIGPTREPRSSALRLAQLMHL